MEKVKVCGITNRGNIREANEDNFYIGGYFPGIQTLVDSYNNNLQYDYENTSDTSKAFAVFDGMGGMNSGEIASFIAVSKFNDFIKCHKDINDVRQGIDRIQEYTGETSCYIYDQSRKNNNNLGMGTTFVCLYIIGDKAVALNVGDSRCYYYSNGKLQQISTDHSRAAYLERNGIITSQAAKRNSDRHKLTRYLGMSIDEGIMVCSISNIIDIQHQDRFLICSDGLYEMIEEKQLIEILNTMSGNECANKLVSTALLNGGLDNITVIVVDFYK